MAKGSMPTHNVRARTGRKDGENDILQTVGVAWKHQNGDGFNIQLNSIQSASMDFCSSSSAERTDPPTTA